MTRRSAALVGLGLLLACAACKKSGYEDLPDGGLGTTCAGSAECGAPYVCIAGLCAPPGQVMAGRPCWATRDCVPGLFCSPAGVCAQGGAGGTGDACATDAQCAAGLRCEHDGFAGACAVSGAGEPGAACMAQDDCLAGLYCGAAATCQPLAVAFPPFAGVDCAPAEPPFRAYFEVPRPGAPPADFYRLPFPNDARVSAAGALDLSDFPRPGPTPLGVDLVDLYADAVAEDFEGFSANAPVILRFSDELEFDSVIAGIHFVDVTAGPVFGQELGLNYGYTTGRLKYACGNRLTIGSPYSSPLLPRHTYAVLLTTAIRGKAGATPVQDPDLVAVLAATRPAADAALGRAWDAYQPLRDWLATGTIGAAGVAVAAVFTVQDTTGHVERLAADVAARPAPVLEDLTRCDAGVVSPCDDGTQQRACAAAAPDFHEIHGRMSVPIYQTGTAPYDRPADGGGIVELGGVPQLQRTEKVCFALTIPRGGAMPAGGWPLVVVHHGTGGSMRSFIGDGIARTLATGATPAAMLGFDAVEHGARRGASSKRPDDLVFNVLNPRAARDNFLQGASDVLQAFRVAGLTIDAASSPVAGTEIRFDLARVAYFGHSQGGTSGELALAFSGAAPAAILSGAGASLSSSLQYKTSPIDVAAGLVFLVGEPLDGGHPVMTLFQTYFDRSDPINYNPLLLRRPPAGVAAKHVYMSYGVGDTYSPAATLVVNALSLGLPPVSPVLEGEFEAAPIARPVVANLPAGGGVQRTAAVFQYPPSGYDGHFVAQRNPAAIADWSAFLSSWLATGVPAIP